MILGGSMAVFLGILVGIIFSSVALSFSSHSLFRLIGDICISVGIGISLCLVIGSLICLIPLIIFLVLDIAIHFYFCSVDLNYKNKDLYRPNNVIFSLIFLFIFISIGYFISMGILSDEVKFNGTITSISSLSDLYKRNIVENMLFTSSVTLTILSTSMAGFLLSERRG